MDVKTVNWPGWEIKAELGYGSFGSVYEIQRNLHGHIERAALKVLSIPQNKREITTLQGDGYDNASIARYYEDTLNKIENEYALMADLKGHSNIVYCDDFRKVPHEDGLGWDIYLKMELLTPLKTYIRSGISNDEIVSLGIDICHALTLCHKLNIIHRDIKPENLFVSRDGTFKLGDFGIAKTLEGTTTGTRIGTLDFMAPEVFNNKPYHMTADIYSLGLVLYWLLNDCCLPFLQKNKKPTPSEKNVANERRVSGEKLPTPRHGSKELQKIILRACAYETKDRYQSAEEMLSDLRKLIGEESIAQNEEKDIIPERGTISPQDERDSSGTIGPDFSAKKAPKKSMKPAIFGGIAAAAIIIVLVVLLSTRGSNTLEITSQPVSIKVAEGENAVVTVEATGKDLTYEWYFAENNILIKSETNCGNSSSVEVQGGNLVYCIITDRKGNHVTSEIAAVGIQNELAITVQPVDVSVAAGELATLTVEAVGDGLSYTWYYANAGETEFDLLEQTIENTYSVTMTDERNGRSMYCVITDANGDSVTTDTVMLSMNSPAIEIIVQPSNIAVQAGAQAKVSVEAIGEGLTYEWYYQNAGADEFVKSESFFTNEYSVAMNSDRNGRQLYCVITDACGESVTTDVVTISMVSTPLEIKTQPQNIFVAEGEQAIVSVEATGDGLAYEWYYQNAGADKFVKSESFFTNEYNVAMNSDRNGRQLYCVITDAHGESVTTDVVTISMVSTPLEIRIQPKDISVAEGEQAIVSVEATGDGLAYEWYYQNAGADSFVKSESFFTNEYNVAMNSDRNGRQLYCVITDVHGNSVTTETVIITMR